jgi:Tol biopolymer transport system component
LRGDNWSQWLDGWTSDSEAVVFRSNPRGHGGIFKQNVRTHETQILVSGPDDYRQAVVSPDGQWLLYTQSSPEDNRGASSGLMRMPLNGGSPILVIPGEFSYSCASQANICVLSEVTRGQRLFSLLDPVKGRGNELAHVASTSDDDSWSLSPDGKSIALISKHNGSQIQIVNTANGSTHAIELKDWILQGVSWSPNNQSLYVSGYSESSWKITSVTLGGRIKELLEVPNLQGWLVWPRPSPDGHYLAYFERTYERNVTMLENF